MAEFYKDFFEEDFEDALFGGKLRMVQLGYITASESCDTILQFNGVDDENNVTYTPLDNLIKRLAWLCHSQWLVGCWGGPKKMSAEPLYLNSPPSTSDFDSGSVGEKENSEADTVTESACPAKGPAEIPMWQLAQRLKTHSAVLKLFDDALNEPWTVNDYVGDRLKPNSDAKPEGQTQDPCAKTPGVAAEQVLQPKSLNGIEAAESASNEELESRKRRQSSVGAACPPAPLPEERPAKRRCRGT